MVARPRYAAIGDYAIIGDCRSVALVSRTGSIDWWCLPRFDGDPVFARLLDADRGGYFEIRPAVAFEAKREYAQDTAVLVTQFRTEAGEVRVTDFMPALTEEQKETHPVPYRCIVRRIQGLSGSVPVHIALRVRPYYGQRTCPPRRQNDRYVLQWPGEALHLTTSTPFETGRETLETKVDVAAGERIDLVLGSSPEAPADLPRLDQLDLLERLTVQYWKNWTAGCSYMGLHRGMVMRSAITLKLLSYAPSGAIIAAPTTSLPELVGGERNWDYRYCWLRDAGWTLRALLRVGNPLEARAFARWLLYATRLTRPELQVMYTVFGETNIPEHTLDWLEGYRGSRPVRVGNAAAQQFQLDIYGEVADALVLYHQSGGTLDHEAHKMIGGLARVIAKRWREPDFGIWEARAGLAHHVHSKIMAWVGLNRCLELARTHPRMRWLESYASVRDEIFEWIMTNGFDRERGYFTATPRGGLDSSLLVIPVVGFLPAQDPRVAATVEAIQQQLAVGELVYRYRTPDGLPGGEGAFVICSFFLIGALARMGRLDEAHDIFERMLTRCNDVGLLAEEIDPSTGDQLGNFPQALSHVGLVNAAITLHELSH